jgi:S1-C subfamily serine protease
MTKKVFRLLSNDGVKGVEARTFEAAYPSEDELLDAYSRAVIHAAEKVSPSVVNMDVRNRPKGKQTTHFRPPEELRGNGSDSSLRDIILTNSHAVHRADKIMVTLPDDAILGETWSERIRTQTWLWSESTGQIF